MPLRAGPPRAREKEKEVRKEKVEKEKAEKPKAKAKAPKEKEKERASIIISIITTPWTGHGKMMSRNGGSPSTTKMIHGAIGGLGMDPGTCSPRPHWNAEARRTIYIHLPDDDYEEGMCGLALKALYGFRTGKANPALFHHEGEDIIGLVHGDDFVTLADDAGQDFFEACLTKRYQYSKKGRLGPRVSGSRELNVFNRYIRWPVGEDIEYEAVPATRPSDR